MDNRDHMFMVEADNKRWWAFCKYHSISKEDARKKVIHVLTDIKRIESYTLLYVGYLNFEESDQEIHNLLPHFEKYEKVWILTENGISD
ncbi:hypothetical protein CVD28_18395 [Bacillus sp. M6-12]|uniref:hypothetical protein n=1 Tax=Bacillus sp. M6-12 TaxID=2054166 RepID=UPI000C784D8C|nr:hypothetical protein [Bacillus sp. M6-12]PLS16024.1 hypothetical protein CVD28_18395 [Bacillus sp. M6-12]